jgi:dihydrofolate reductase / thymidylate synthase
MQITLVIARDEHNGIGRDGRIPWVNKQDIDIFRIVTTTTNDPTKKNLVVAGHRTREEMPVSLKNRHLVTLGRDASYAPPPSIEARDIERTFIVGGRDATLAFYKRYGLPACIVLTRVDGVFDCDVHLDDDDLWLDHYVLYAKKRLDGATTFVYILRGSNSTVIPPGVRAAGVVPDETQYTDLVHDIIANGERRDEERTGVGALSVFGRQLRFDLEHSFPLFTTKRTFFRGVIEELAWFLSGETDASILDRRGVGIWTGNSSRDFLDRYGLPYPEGVCGPIYGSQWRHFGGEYFPTTGSSIGGVDQIKAVIESIRTAPESRRHIVTSYNPSVLDDVVLAPCHVLAQFYASAPHRDGKRRLVCHVYQRSCDVGLGLPFNVASYALLTYLIAASTDCIPGELVMSLGDTHLYRNHIDAMREILARNPYAPPTIRLADRIINAATTSDSLGVINAFIDDPVGSVQLCGYTAHDRVKLEMAI